MSFFIQTGPSPGGRLAETLGASLGEGVSQGLAGRKEQEQGSILSRVLTGQATPEEIEKLSPQIQLKLAEIQSKPPPGGIGAQPVPPEVRQVIPQILNENKEATADELATKFDEAGIPRSFSDSYIETRRRQDEQAAQREVKGEEIARKEQIEFHKESKAYDDLLTQKADTAEEKLKAIERQMKIQPDITNWDRFFASAFKGSIFEDLFKSQSATEFDAAVLPLIEGMRDVFGVRLTDADLRLVLQKIATSQKNPEANKTILDWMKLKSELEVEKRKIADQIKKENRGLRPLDFQEQIRQRYNEKFGDEIEVKSQAVLSLSDNEKEVAEIQRVKVDPGTPLNTESIDLYLKLSDGDHKKAEKMALEDGYVF